MAIIRDMAIHMEKTTMANILIADMDIPIRNMDIIIPKAKVEVEAEVEKKNK